MKDLGNKSMSAVLWGGGGSALKIILQFGSQIVLARALGPQQYGLFALGSIVISFSNFFSDVGIAYGLIQKDTVTQDDMRFVFTWQLILGLFVTLVVASLSGPIANFLGDASAQWVVAGLSIVCLLNALCAPANNMLKRLLDFRSIQIASIVSYFVGYIVIGIPVALVTHSVWSLVLAWIAQALITLVILYNANRHSLRLQIWYPGAKGMVRYGATVLVTNIINWFIGNIERVVIARFFPSREVGLYATAYNFVYGPVATFVGIVQPVFFSSGARMAQDPVRVSKTYLGLTGLVALICFPVFAGLACVADTFVLALYGAAWHSAGELLKPLALAMPFFLLWGLTTPLLWLGGNPASEFKLQLPMALLWVAVSIVAAQRSVVCVAWAVLVLFVSRYTVVLAMALRMMPMTLLDLANSLKGGVVLGLLCSAAAFATDTSSWAVPMHPALRLACVIGAGGVTLVLSLLMAPRLVPIDCAPLINRLAARAPQRLARQLRAFAHGD